MNQAQCDTSWNPSTQGDLESHVQLHGEFEASLDERDRDGDNQTTNFFFFTLKIREKN